VSIRSIGDVIDNSCHDRPTIVDHIGVLLGHVHSGVAREQSRDLHRGAPDRTSFGCSEDLKYTSSTSACSRRCRWCRIFWRWRTRRKRASPIAK
jgi:hypothetical protein